MDARKGKLKQFYFARKDILYMRLYSQIFIPTSFATRISSLIPANHSFAICSWNGLICRSCGAVIDLPMEPLSDIDQKAQACTAGQVEDHTIFFFGRCADCLKKESH